MVKAIILLYIIYRYTYLPWNSVSQFMGILGGVQAGVSTQDFANVEMKVAGLKSGVIHDLDGVIWCYLHFWEASVSLHFKTCEISLVNRFQWGDRSTKVVLSLINLTGLKPVFRANSAQQKRWRSWCKEVGVFHSSYRRDWLWSSPAPAP